MSLVHRRSVTFALAALFAAAGSPAALAHANASGPAPDGNTPRTATDQAWQHIVQAADHRGLPFAIVDKQQALLTVFDGRGHPIARTPVLLGLAPGDDITPGVGQRAQTGNVAPQERTTPAGRFIGERGSNATGEDVVWVDYDAAVSMHRVRPLVAAERRLQRLASPTPTDNRISYGCINVPVAFFEAQIEPLFRQGKAVIYVLPETRPVQTVFHSYDVQARQAAAVARGTTPG